MTKGALRYRFIPIDPEWHKSDLFYDLAKDFGSAGPLTWLIINLEWREPEAEITERDGQRGLYRRVRLHYLLNLIPMDVGPKKVAAIILWLEDRKHLTIEDEDRTNLGRLRDEPGTTHRRAKHGPGTMVGLFCVKSLKYREGVFGYSKGEERRVLEPGSIEPNQDESKPSFEYVLNKQTGEYDRVSLAEKDLREDIDA